MQRRGSAQYGTIAGTQLGPNGAQEDHMEMLLEYAVATGNSLIDHRLRWGGVHYSKHIFKDAMESSQKKWKGAADK